MDANRAKALLGQIREKRAGDPVHRDRLSNLFGSDHGEGYISRAIRGTADSLKNLGAERTKELNEKAIAAANSSIGRMLLLGLGTGAALRGFQGLYDTYGDTKPRATASSPYLRFPNGEPKEEKKAFLGMFGGSTTKETVPYYLPGLALGTPLAVYGGWKGVDSLLRRQDRGKLDDDIEKSKQQYEAELARMSKLSSNEQFAEADAALEAAHSKMAMTWGWGDIPGFLTGAYSTYAIPATVVSYLAAKKLADKGSNRGALKDAIRERRAHKEKENPPAMMAIQGELPKYLGDGKD